MREHSRCPIVIVALVLLLLAVAGCSKKQKSGAAPGKGGNTELTLLMWSEYIDEKIVADFEKREGVRVRVTTYDSTEEMEGKLAYGGADSQYDVVVLVSQVVPRFARRGLIRPLDHAKIPNLKNLDPRFSGAAFDDGNKHAIPYQWGTVGLLYDKKKLPSLEPSWAAVLDAKNPAGTFILIDEMRDMIGIALKYMGRSSNSTNPEDIRAAHRILQEAKASPKCLGFKGIGGAQDVKSGAADIALMWNGYALREIEADKDRFAYVIPKEGSVIWMDTMVIPQKAPNADLAHKFIDFMLEPQIGARLSAFLRYATPNAAARAHVSPADASNPVIYPPEDMMSRLEPHKDLGEALKVFDEAWTTLKAH